MMTVKSQLFAKSFSPLEGSLVGRPHQCAIGGLPAGKQAAELQKNWRTRADSSRGTAQIRTDGPS